MKHYTVSQKLAIFAHAFIRKLLILSALFAAVGGFFYAYAEFIRLHAGLL